jgi:hypothetical protein
MRRFRAQESKSAREAMIAKARKDAADRFRRPIVPLAEVCFLSCCAGGYDSPRHTLIIVHAVGLPRPVDAALL